MYSLLCIHNYVRVIVQYILMISYQAVIVNMDFVFQI